MGVESFGAYLMTSIICLSTLKAIIEVDSINFVSILTFLVSFFIYLAYAKLSDEVFGTNLFNALLSPIFILVIVITSVGPISIDLIIKTFNYMRRQKFNFLAEHEACTQLFDWSKVLVYAVALYLYSMNLIPNSYKYEYFVFDAACRISELQKRES